MLRSFAAASLCLVSQAGSSAAGTAIAVTDIAGRHIKLPRLARRIVLAQGRQLPALALVHTDPVSVLAGIGGEFQRQDPQTYEHYRRAFPSLDAVPIVGKGTPDSFSVERAIAAQPDVVILSRNLAGALDSEGSNTVIRQFATAGIPVLIADFYARPLEDTVPSLRLIGRILGTEARAEAYVTFYQARLARIRERCGQAATQPHIFMQTHAGGTECCFSPGKGTFNDYISAAGGLNVAAALLPGLSGQLAIEQVLDIDPDFYVGTGGSYQAAQGGLVLGMGVSEEEARRTFARVLQARGIADLTAVRDRRAFGLWQSFNDNPVHVLAIEVMAKWFHPDLFGDVDPLKTLQEINAFLAVPMQGTYWIGSA